MSGLSKLKFQVQNLSWIWTLVLPPPPPPCSSTALGLFKKNKTFTSHSSRGCKSEIRMPAWTSEGPLPGQKLLVVSSCGQGDWGALLALFYRGTNPKGPTCYWGLSFQHTNFGETQTFRLKQLAIKLNLNCRDRSPDATFH